MATMNETQNVVAECTGFNIEHVHALGNALAAAWDEPAADGAHYPELQPRYVTLLLLALAANAMPANAAEIAERYYALPNTVRDSVPTAGAMIEAMLLTHYEGTNRKTAQVVWRSDLEVCHATDAVCMTTETTDGPRHVVFLGREVSGTLCAFDEHLEGMRRSYTILGRQLYRIANELRHTGPIQRTTGPITQVAGATL